MWQIRAIQYAARLPQLVLVWRGASAYPARPFADYPRTVLGGGGTLETDFAQMSIGPPKGDSRPASAQRLQRDGAGGVNGSISLSSSPRAARQRPIWSHGTAPLTPRLGAPRPPSRRIRPRTGWEKQLLLHRAGQRASDRLSTSYWGHRSAGGIAGPASSPLSPALAGVRLHRTCIRSTFLIASFTKLTEKFAPALF